MLFLGAIALEIPLAKAIERKAEKERLERAEKARVEAEKETEGEMYRKIVWTAYLGLKSQHAVGYGPWLASLIGRIGETPRAVTREIAIQALRMTRDELAGSRFNLSGLDSAILSLEEMGAGR